ncbi:hypothetical protein K504DRAFT_394598 [Pleomassaria siparia CBS 279.74]|uniref:Protein kinase domain-containing protein n=1 Tax=Pleomassaria siparia CBS 279.74 TaxID=1314801 RepID=A0A6G1KN88_9PLEO|nr:hypothetical protein K504DRAFT_394598 [Pleomassaria siparia CBS 279.74]
MSARDASVQWARPRDRPVSISTNDEVLSPEVSTHRSLHHRTRSSTSALPRPVTQRRLPTDDEPSVSSPNYNLSKIPFRTIGDNTPKSHIHRHSHGDRRDRFESLEAQHSRRGSHQEDRLVRSRIRLPTPESVLELTHGGSSILPCVHGLETSHSYNGKAHSCSNCNSQSADNFNEAIAEPDILDTPSNLSAAFTDRSYTPFLGVPDDVGHNSPLVLSVISDAGDQQQKHQKRSSARDSSFHSDFTLEESLDSLPSEHELQERILAARQQTQNNEGQLKRFIPKEKLCEVVNPESVARELLKKLPPLHSSDTIKAYAKDICRETKIVRRDKTLIKSYLKIFALLVLVDAVPSILLFLEDEKDGDDVSDLELPLTLVEGTGGLYRHGDPRKKPLKCFKHRIWSPFKLESFQEKQWWMLAPFFSRGLDGSVKHYILQDEHVLPFLPPTLSHQRTDTITHRIGGYGKVSMVQIHNEHHNFQDATLHNRGFAVKQQLYDEHRAAYKKEIAILKRFTEEQSHKHVVSLLASYEQFRKFHLIFYRAEGDLFEYWKHIQQAPRYSYENVLWVAEQCAGLTDALSKLHRHLSIPKVVNAPMKQQKERTIDHAAQKQPNKRVNFLVGPRTDSWGNDGIKERPPSPIVPCDNRLAGGEIHRKTLHRSQTEASIKPMRYGRHGDINPGNILWYNDVPGGKGTLRGTLKITDFGQAELNSSLSRTKRQSVAMTLTYRPPECDMQPRVIRQSYDIWCLGCVFLEFVTWTLGGSELLNKFIIRRWTPDVLLQNNSRTDIFFKLVRHKDSHELEAIIKPEVTQFINTLHELPNCTEYFHELLVMIQNDMLVVESNQRRSCASIWTRLNNMHEKCQTDKDYAMTTNPWCLWKQAASSRGLYKRSEEEVRTVGNPPPSRIPRRKAD